MVAGRVVRFDETRGYGFITPETGGDDVFLHVNDLLIPESYVRSGLAVEFEVVDRERGPKAARIRLAESARTAREADRAVPVQVVPAAVPAPVAEEPMCDVLSTEETNGELTELLLRVTSLTAGQIVEIRRGVLELARGHGWVEG
ncbi:cold-shock protein [Streptomyces sp. NPDC058579]|uniref:cold-shock protein n=1 Tax=Streptomyces sp. NPDC058579 TaxID=3346548 RepID=UPI00365B1329